MRSLEEWVASLDVSLLAVACDASASAALVATLAACSPVELDGFRCEVFRLVDALPPEQVAALAARFDARDRHVPDHPDVRHGFWRAVWCTWEAERIEEMFAAA